MATSPVAAGFPGSEEVRSIARIADPMVRNLSITEAYHRLASAFCSRTGPQANWCCFAVWASRQAGRTIRAEDVIEILKAQTEAGPLFLHPVQAVWRWLLRRGLLFPESRLGSIVRHVHSPFDAVERASAMVARGNLKVFQEIAGVFARYLESCPAGGGVESPEFQRFLQDLQPGEAPGGQDLLRRAFSRYQVQQRTMDPSLRAQQILLANLEIGMHEQIRLQEEIAGSLEAVPGTAEDLGVRALQAIYPGAWNWKAFVRRPLARLLAPAARAFAQHSRHVSRQAITASMMTLAFPETTLELCCHIDRAFPEPLKGIREPELQSLIAKLEPDGSDCNDCAARDWSRLNERMHYILHLFRSFQMDPALFQPPYTERQAVSIRIGHVPEGRL